MNRKILAYSVPVLFLLLWVLAGQSSAEVIIVNETKPSFYAVSQMELRGDMETNKLVLTGSGQVITGEKSKVYLLGRASDMLIENLKVNGRDVTVSFDDKGYFMVLDEGDFTFQGDLLIRTAGQVRIYVPGPVNALKFALKHGYAIRGDQYGLLADEVLIQRSEKVAMLSEGSFRYTFAEKNSFQYQIRYRSFGSSLGQTSLELRNGENVLSVSGDRDHSISGNRLIIDLEGDQASVVVTGTFSSNRLTVPVDEGRHHVLVESDPQKRLDIVTSAEEIDLKQSTITPSYSNARVFLAGKDTPIDASITDLQTYPSLAAAVRYATNRIAITEKGSMLAELHYDYDNTGEDYITIDAPGTPLYAATGYRDAVKLTKFDDKLFLSFPKVKGGSLDMIYFDTRNPLLPIDYIVLPIANTNLTITTAQTQVILPEDYVVLWTFGAKGGNELPSLEALFIFTLIFGGLGYMMRQKVGFSIMYLIFCAGLYYFSWMLLLISAMASIAFLVRKQLSGVSMRYALVAVGALILISLAAAVFIGLLSMGISSSGTSARQASMVDSNYASVDKAEMAPIMGKSMEVMGSGPGSINMPVKEGVLPVRLELPQLGKTITVTSYVVSQNNPLKISVLIVAGWFRYLLYAVSLFAGVLCLKDLRRLRKNAKVAEETIRGSI
ncbi:MAG: hypothetical protein V1875_04195 [Candidatus Altiarchaeota archaeon]